MEAFCQAVKGAVQRAYPGCTVEVYERTMNNGVQKKCLSIKSSIFSSFPDIPLEKFYEDYINGRDLLTISLAIAALYEERQSYNDFPTEMMNDYSQVKQRLCYGLINYEKNRKMLENTPHIRFLDLAVIFFVPVRIFRHNMDRILIKKTMMDEWGISDPGEPYESAHKNTCQILGGRIASSDNIQDEAILKGSEIDPEILKEVLDAMAKPDAKSLFAATNDIYLYGAAVILYDRLLESFSKMAADDIVILPSSIHECMLVPAASADIEELREIVADINQTVDKEEILSDNIYLYNRAADKVSIIGVDGKQVI